MELTVPQSSGKRGKLGSYARLAACGFTFLLSTAAVTWYAVRKSQLTARTDLWPWTCSNKEMEVQAGNHHLGFDTVCNEMVSFLDLSVICPWLKAAAIRFCRRRRYLVHRADHSD